MVTLFFLSAATLKLYFDILLKLFYNIMLYRLYIIIIYNFIIAQKNELYLRNLVKNF